MVLSALTCPPQLPRFDNIEKVNDIIFNEFNGGFLFNDETFNQAFFH